MTKKILSQTDVAEILHVSTHYVTKLRRCGYITGRRCGKRWLYTEDEIDRFIDNTYGEDLHTMRMRN